MSSLPTEILIQVIGSLIPASPPVVFPRSHPVTRTLVSLTLASSVTSDIARRLLNKHCLYIDSEPLFWKVFTLRKRPVYNLNAAPPHGLFLSPFQKTLEESPEVTKSIDLLFSDFSGKLTRLVIDIPLRSLYPEDDTQKIRPKLRAAFSRLTAIEEFCSIQDELFLETQIEGHLPEVWSSWTQLRCLALYNVDCKFPEFINGLKKCRNLTHLVLTRPDCLSEELDQEVDFCDFKQLKRVVIVNSERTARQDYQLELAPATFLGRLEALRLADNTAVANEGCEPEPLCTFVAVSVPPDEEVDDIDLCQRWVCEHAIDGTLWDFPGIPLFQG